MEDTSLTETTALEDMLVRSRKTLLDILEERGYDATPYRDIAPGQLQQLLRNPRAMDMLVKRKEGSSAPCPRAVVIYMLNDRIRLRLGTFLRDVYETSTDGTDEGKPRREDDLIVILNEPYNDAFDKASLKHWQQQKARLSFFHIKQTVVHLGKHSLVPPHRKMTPDEAKAEMEALHITQKTHLPLIKHHDIQARILGLVPGDMVEILRPSPTAGVARVLRICSA
jgi:DNA-directed RNA polymerase subunit H (RpoH/RPB5)